jgi:hypothetical protein
MQRILFLLLAIATFSAQAQSETQTLLGKGKLNSWGLMISPSLQTANVYGETALFTQMKVGAVLNGNWTIGAFSGVNPLELYPAGLQAQFARPTDFRLYTGGGFVEYRVQPTKLLHLAFPLAIGGVLNDMDDRDWNGNVDLNDDGEDYRIFVEPGVNLELNLHKYARLYTGLSYRFHGNSVYSEGLSVPFTGDYLLINAGLKFGIFDFKDIKKKKD